jgi:toxin ParE1/3/4
MPLRWTAPAVKDLVWICDYTEVRFDPAQARRTAIAIYDAAESLEAHPLLGRIGRRPNTREPILSNLPFLIVYRVDHRVVEITRVLHGAQKWP